MPEPEIIAEIDFKMFSLNSANFKSKENPKNLNHSSYISTSTITVYGHRLADDDHPEVRPLITHLELFGNKQDIDYWPNDMVDWVRRNV